MTADDPLYRAFLSEAARLVAQLLEHIQRDDPEAAAGLARAVRAGALLELRSTFAPAAGLAHLRAALVEPGGTEHVLGEVDLQRIDGGGF